MIADDDQDDVDIFSEVLAEFSKINSLLFNLSVANDGVELMKELKTQAELPKMLFLDINMPLKDGLTCLVEIKADDRYKNMMVIMLSTSSHHTHIRKAYEIGADLYIIKSNDYITFKGIIFDCLISKGSMSEK